MYKRQLEAAVNRHRQYAAGYISYEAAAAYGLAVRAPPRGLPLLWFGLYDGAAILDAPATPTIEPLSAACYSIGSWQPAIERAAYEKVVGRVKDYLAHGHSYQVNYCLLYTSRCV